MIHRKAMIDIMQRESNGKKIPFSLKYVKKSTGEIISIEEGFLISYYMKKRSINIKIVGSDQVRSLRTSLIVEFNGSEVYV